MILSPLKPPLSFPTLTGSIVTFNAQYALPLKSHKIALTATQSGSGTPSPQNIRTINGYSAINIWGVGKNFLDLGDKTTTGSSYLANKISCFLKAGTYTFSYSFSGANNSGFVAFYDESNNEIYNTSHYTSVGANTKIIVLPSTAYKFTFYSNAVGSYTDFQIEIGSMATSFEVYNGTQTTINIGQTVYGGEYDARTGVLTVTHGFVTYDSNNVPYMQIGTISGGVKTRVFIRQSGVSQSVSGVPDILCNIANPVEVNAQYQGNEGISIRVNANVNNQGFYIYDEDIQTLTEWQDYINNNSITVVYPLATQQTIQLPPCPIDTLEVNNIWADTGDTTLQYPKFG